jgi:hypothetical protein
VTKDRARRKKRRRIPEGGIAPAERPIPRPGPYRIGRVLQFVGLLILPFGIASELVGRVGLGQSLLIAGAGALIFYVGFVIQNRAGLG